MMDSSGYSHSHHSSKDDKLSEAVNIDEGGSDENFTANGANGSAEHQNAFFRLKERVDPKNIDPDTKEKIKAGLFLTTISGLSILSGFGMTLGIAKKQDPNNFARGLSGSREIPESGISLASRALARGTLISVAGVSLFCITVWKLLGVHNLQEFRYKVGTMLPKIPKSENQGRGDFKTIRDLFQFVIDEDEREKREKEASGKT